MSVRIEQFKNRNNEKIAGLSPEHAIYDDNGIRLDDKLKDITKGKGLQDKSVITRVLADEAVTTDKLADDAIVNQKIKDGTIELDKLSSNVRDAINAATGVPGDLAEKLDKLMEEVFPLNVNVTITPNAIQRKNTTVDVTISWTANIEGESVTPDEVIINGEEVDVSQGSHTTQARDTTTYAVKVILGNRETIVKKTITFAYPIYTGFASNTAFSASLIPKLTSPSLRASLGVITDTKANSNISNYYWIVSPYEVKSVTTSGINIFSDFIKSTATYDETTYYCYRLSKASAVDTFTFIIS